MRIGRASTLSRDASFAALAAVALTASRFLLTAIVARRLSQADFGRFAYVVWLIDIGFLICSLGATGAVSRYAAEFRGEPPRLAAFMRSWSRWGLWIPLITGGAAVLGALASGFALNLLAGMSLLVWAAAQGRWALHTAALSGSQRFDAILLGNLIAGCVMVLGVALLPIDQYGAALLFMIMAAGSICGALVGRTFIRSLSLGHSVDLSRVEGARIRTYALNMWVTALLWALVWSRGEFPLVRVFVGDEKLGVYAATMTIFGGGVQAVMLGVAGIAPQLTRFLAELKTQSALDAAHRIMSLQLLIGGLICLTLVCYGSEVLGLAFGPSYREGAGMLAILSIGVLTMVLSAQNHVLQIVTDARFSRNVSLVGLIALAVLAVGLIPSLGIEGAAIARTGTMLLLCIVSIRAVRQRWRTMAGSFSNLYLCLAICVAAGVAAHIAGLESLVERSVIFLATSLGLISVLRTPGGKWIVVESVQYVGDALRKAGLRKVPEK